MSPRPLETDPCGLEASHTLYKGRRMSGSVSRGPGRFLEGLVGFGNDIRSDFNVFWRAGRIVTAERRESRHAQNKGKPLKFPMIIGSGTR